MTALLTTPTRRDIVVFNAIVDCHRIVRYGFAYIEQRYVVYRLLQSLYCCRCQNVLQKYTRSVRYNKLYAQERRVDWGENKNKAKL